MMIDWLKDVNSIILLSTQTSIATILQTGVKVFQIVMSINVIVITWNLFVMFTLLKY